MSLSKFNLLLVMRELRVVIEAPAVLVVCPSWSVTKSLYPHLGIAAEAGVAAEPVQRPFNG